MATLTVRQISKSFGETVALRDVSFEVASGEILCLLGPSGCGKTTVLRIVAGLETADRGTVLVNGEDLGDVPVHERGLGLMFQAFALFPHKDVRGNVAFGLRMAGLPDQEIARRVKEALDMVGLGGFERRAVHELSGGEQQRVALARSLAPRPRLLMLDEPLGSLDRALRERLMNELREILKSVGVTALYVTHDQSEAFAVGDRVVIMHRGCIEQIGQPETVYRHPASPFVARFLGMENLLPGRVVDAETVRVSTELGELEVREPASGIGEEQKVTVLLRPEAARLLDGAEEAVNRVRGRVLERSFRGAYYRLLMQPHSGPALSFELEATDHEVPAVEEEVTLSLRPGAINLFPSPETPAVAGNETG